MSVITYIRFEEVEPWVKSYNTETDSSHRNGSYYEFKERKARILLDQLSELIPRVRDMIKSYHSSTPLTLRDYLNNEDGSLYGIQRNFEFPIHSFVNTKTKNKNLYLTGQNQFMHRVLGVTIGAIDTCSEIIGGKYLVGKIKACLEPTHRKESRSEKV